MFQPTKVRINTTPQRPGASHLNENGFTLIEILIATVLLSIGFIGYMFTIGSTVDRNDVNKKTLIAISLAEEKVEELKTNAIDTPLATGTTYDTVDGIYTRTWVVTNGGAGNLTEIFVTVAWPDQVPQQVQLRTLLSQ